MKFFFIILVFYVVSLQADRTNLPNLGISLPDLGNVQRFFPASLSNTRNVHVKVTKHKQSTDHSQQPPDARNLAIGNYLNQNIANKHEQPVLPLDADGGISLDSINFFDKSLHEPEQHIPPYPIIPFNASQNTYQHVSGVSEHSSTNQHPIPNIAVPHPFSVDANAGVQNPDIANPSLETKFGFSSSSSHQDGSIRPEHNPFDYNSEVSNSETYFNNNENATSLFNDFVKPPLIYDHSSRGNFPSEDNNNYQEPFSQDHLHDRNPPTHVSSETEEDLQQIIDREWSEFRTRFNKVYATLEEENFRREVFIENRAKIQRLNTEYAEGRRNYVQRINPYADMLLHEFTTQHCGFNRSRSVPRKPIKPASAFLPSANVVFPSSVDWREVGAVGPVRTQGRCAGCWAFAAAGALEGHQFRKTGNLVDISPQNLIDCTEPYGNNGCLGGLMNPAFEYVRDNNGVDSEQSYPYEERTDQCRFRREDVVATCTGFVDIGENDEKGLEIALATLGPVTAAIDATRDSFQFYSDGIYDDPECGNTPEKMNHAVLIVGYGTDPDGRKYWLVKNSYGPQWGIGGYIKLAKDNYNQCGIAIQASYPLV